MKDKSFKSLPKGMVVKMRTGIFGGTFDPVHIGHVRAAEAFVSQLGLDRLFVLPNCIAPMKNGESASPEDRLEMLKIAFTNMEKAEVSDFELKSGGTSYTYRTIEHYMKLFPDDSLFLLIGDDNLLIFRKWVNFEYILGNCTLCVAKRMGADIDKEKETLEREYGAKIAMLEYTPTMISSTELRCGLKEVFLPVGVSDYIMKKGLYTAQRVSSQKIIKELKLSKERTLHTLGVAECAKRLARRHFPTLSEEKIEIAALLHDCTKELPLEKQKELCERYKINISDEDRSIPKLYHAKTAAVIARDVYGVDEETADAIYYHTTGREDMTEADICLYFADYIEEYRTFADCIRVREYYNKQLEKESDHLVALKKGLLFSFDLTVKNLLKKGEAICLDTIRARNRLINELKERNNEK